MLYKSRNEILYGQPIAKRFFHYQTCPARALEGSTKLEKEKPVPTTAKKKQMVKTNDAMKKLCQPKGKTTNQ